MMGPDVTTHTHECTHLEHPLDRLAITDNRVLRESIRHHLIAADQVFVDNHDTC